MVHYDLCEIHNMVLRAEVTATYLHTGQRDKAGQPYIKHPEAVSEMMDTDEEKAVV